MSRSMGDIIGTLDYVDNFSTFFYVLSTSHALSHSRNTNSIGGSYFPVTTTKTTRLEFHFFILNENNYCFVRIVGAIPIRTMRLRQKTYKKMYIETIVFNYMRKQHILMMI